MRMKSMLLTQSLRIAGRGLRNYITRKPLVISFEVTHSCTCNCLHCNRGGETKEVELLKPADYARLVSTLRPSVVQLSGGEPLLRRDVLDIVRAIRKYSNTLPYIILVTNGSLLNPENYGELKRAGVDRFSVSLDFPNEKHDEFRRHPGLYSHLEETLPALVTGFGYDDIALNSAITSNNMTYLCDLARKAEKWGVNISYSAYGVLRTGDPSFFVRSKEHLQILQREICELIKLKRDTGRILNSTYVLRKTYEFFRDGCIPNCNAGKRFLVVTPKGYLIPCSMRPHRRLYSTQEEMLGGFTRHNECGQCYVAIRSYSDKSFGRLVRDSLSLFFSEIF